LRSRDRHGSAYRRMSLYGRRETAPRWKPRLTVSGFRSHHARPHSEGTWRRCRRCGWPGPRSGIPSHVRRFTVRGGWHHGSRGRRDLGVTVDRGVRTVAATFGSEAEPAGMTAIDAQKYLGGTSRFGIQVSESSISSPDISHTKVDSTLPGRQPCCYAGAYGCASGPERGTHPTPGKPVRRTLPRGISPAG
jgi:hypothetical protein